MVGQALALASVGWRVGLLLLVGAAAFEVVRTLRSGARPGWRALVAFLPPLAPIAVLAASGFAGAGHPGWWSEAPGHRLFGALLIVTPIVTGMAATLLARGVRLSAALCGAAAMIVGQLGLQALQATSG